MVRLCDSGTDRCCVSTRPVLFGAHSGETTQETNVSRVCKKTKEVSYQFPIQIAIVPNAIQFRGNAA